ncbi:hypothetical protein LCGC14_0859710 [marine sediment metagenome]|uniref:Uncharacterized protein n=1 Tax=marine sediment metagenome TaxID=412755 RepID=A0A0F9RSG0_9ZZZZ
MVPSHVLRGRYSAAFGTDQALLALTVHDWYGQGPPKYKSAVTFLDQNQVRALAAGLAVLAEEMD